MIFLVPLLLAGMDFGYYFYIGQSRRRPRGPASAKRSRKGGNCGAPGGS